VAQLGRCGGSVREILWFSGGEEVLVQRGDMVAQLERCGGSFREMWWPS
jgi:hypothetical protein